MEHNSDSKRWIVAMTGASGTIYARRLVSVMVEEFPDVDVDVVISEAGLRVLREEDGIKTSVSKADVEELFSCDPSRIRLHNNRDIGASIASGSYPTHGMVVVPCSMSTLAAIAHGHGQNLIHRAADVVLKEGRKLIIVPRETPFSAIHLENMLKLDRCGAKILPAMPGFYHQPSSIMDLVDMLVMRILDQMGLPCDLTKRWKQEQPASERWPVRAV